MIKYSAAISMILLSLRIFLNLTIAQCFDQPIFNQPMTHTSWQKIAGCLVT